MPPKDPILNSVKLLVALGSFAAKPGLISGLRSGVSVHDTLRQMLGKAPPGMRSLAAELAADAQATLNGFAKDLPRDAPILLEQMVEMGLPEPPRSWRWAWRQSRFPT